MGSTARSIYFFVSMFLMGFMYGMIKKQEKVLDLGANVIDSCNNEAQKWFDKYMECGKNSYYKDSLKIQNKY